MRQADGILFDFVLIRMAHALIHLQLVQAKKSGCLHAICHETIRVTVFPIPPFSFPR